MSNIKGSVVIEWDIDQVETTVYGSEFILEESAKQDEDSFWQMFKAYPEHPNDNSITAELYLEITVNSQRSIESISHIKIEGPATIVSDSISVDGPDTEDEDYDDFIDD